MIRFNDFHCQYIVSSVIDNASLIIRFCKWLYCLDSFPRAICFWFFCQQDTLLDADVAINAMMWQNGGMSGLDQWNFVMHPVDAALTCDPNGHYVRRWCPELSALPDDYIHKPWKCPPSILRRAVVELGEWRGHLSSCFWDGKGRGCGIQDLMKLTFKQRFVAVTYIHDF